ncbi:MAG TPA: type II secretion system protein N [Burkholderiales bacterium]|nr:type II secretion system protein N [Burkholderiales bacterium]
MSLATLVALALLGLVLAYWTWAWLAPRAQPRAPAALHTRGRAQAASGLFGSAQRAHDGAAATGIAVRLLGVVAASGSGPGYAVLRLDAKRTVAVREGGEIEPGVSLARVHADHIVLERSGVRETLTWPKRGKLAQSTAPLAHN